MINTELVTSALKRRYEDLERVHDQVFRAIDRYGGNTYAVRYFDLSDDLVSAAGKLREYQDKVLGTQYFDPKAASDLRWNHYLYFVTSQEQASHNAFAKAKALVESDRDYARKQVIQEDELDRIFESSTPDSLAPKELPRDLLSTWITVLEGKGLSYVLDFKLQVPEIVRRILAGKRHQATKPPDAPALNSAERAASDAFLGTLHIKKGFRKYPTPQRQFQFGVVNLIVGANGAGKTSLLEAIEYLYCGKVMRGERLLPDTQVSGQLLGTNHQLTTSSKTPQKQLRDRHLVWYGVNELKTLTIQASFNKFNFLNSDAAARLSVEDSETQIGNDVAQLVLGPQASGLLDRLERVQNELEARKRDIHKDASLKQAFQHEAQQRLTTLLNATRTSDSLFSELGVVLQQVNWISRPKEKSEAKALSKQLQTAISETEVLERLSSGSAKLLSEGALETTREKIRKDLDSTTDLGKREMTAKAGAAECDDKLKLLQERIEALNALSPYISADFESLLQKKLNLETSVSTLTGALVSAQDIDAVSLSEDVLNQPIKKIVPIERARMSELQRQLAHAKRVLENFEKSQSNMATLYQGLRSTAQEILSQVTDPDHCPLCHTQFEKGELAIRILSQIDSASEQTYVQLRATFQTAQQQVASLGPEIIALEALVTFVERDPALSVLVRDAVDQFRKARERLKTDQAELKMVERKVIELARSGLTPSRLRELMDLAQIDRSLPTKEKISGLQKTLKESVVKQQKSRQAALEDLKKIEAITRVLAQQYSVETPVAVGTLARHIREQLADHDRAMEATRELGNILRLGRSTTPTELTVKLERAHSLLVQLMTASAQEAVADMELKKTTENIEKYKKDADELDVQLRRAKDAESVLVALSTEHSKDALTAQILKENSEAIGRIFKSIHAPSEFDLKAEGEGFRIIRREDNEAVELNEMSTGQRAGFALSLFLAMNARLQAGPKVLLFDDPIAHVDDINMLSFLDFLREMTLKETRQIFFATADSKLAGLFRHKFSFLGDQRFREIHLQREE